MTDCHRAMELDPDNAQVRLLKSDIKKVQEAEVCHRLHLDHNKPPDEELDPFASFDTPTVEQVKLCMVCMDRPRDCRLLPCLHAGLCFSCAQTLQSRKQPCPVCSVEIQWIERGHFTRTYTKEGCHGATPRPVLEPTPSPLSREASCEGARPPTPPVFSPYSRQNTRPRLSHIHDPVSTIDEEKDDDHQGSVPHDIGCEGGLESMGLREKVVED